MNDENDGAAGAGPLVPVVAVPLVPVVAVPLATQPADPAPPAFAGAGSPLVEEQPILAGNGGMVREVPGPGDKDYSAAPAEPVLAKAGATAGPVESTEVEKAIASAFADSHDGTTFAGELEKRGIALARVTAADVAAMAAETAANVGRRFPAFAEMELAAVDRFGDVHKLDPERPDAAAIQDRFNETRMRKVEVQPVEGSVADAHAAFGARYALTGMDRLRAALKTRIAGVRAQVAEATKGDHRATVSALGGLTDLIHDLFAKETPADSLHAALAALAAGGTDDVRKSLEAARASLLAGDVTGVMPGQAGLIVDEIVTAESALASGDRADCQRLIETALDMVGWPA